MAKIVVFENVTLDGVMQGPGRADEDTRGGFEHSGWATPYASPADAEVAQQSMRSTGAILLGKRTYEDFYDFWPKQKDNPYTEVLTNTEKYVVSTTLGEPLPWQNSTLIKGDVPEAVRELKSNLDKDIVVLGSGKLLHTLMRRNLVDIIILRTHPLVLGSGARLFDESNPSAKMELTDSTTTPTGVVVATYLVTG